MHAASVSYERRRQAAEPYPGDDDSIALDLYRSAERPVPPCLFEQVHAASVSYECRRQGQAAGPFPDHDDTQGPIIQPSPPRTSRFRSRGPSSSGDIRTGVIITRGRRRQSESGDERAREIGFIRVAVHFRDDLLDALAAIILLSPQDGTRRLLRGTEFVKPIQYIYINKTIPISYQAMSHNVGWLLCQNILCLPFSLVPPFSSLYYSQGAIPIVAFPSKFLSQLVEF